MTREKAIKMLQGGDLCRSIYEEEEALDMGIRSLEAWEQVKADIKEHTKRYSLSSEQNCLGTVLWSKYMISFDDVIAIIDKHLQEV